MAKLIGDILFVGDEEFNVNGDYIQDIISDCLSAEDREDTPANRVDVLNFIHNTSYLDDVRAEAIKADNQ